jgi:Synergist-CTERM protein sorting domain-containing protein
LWTRGGENLNDNDPRTWVKPLLDREKTWGRHAPFAAEVSFSKMIADALSADPAATGDIDTGNNQVQVPLAFFTDKFDENYAVGCTAVMTGQIAQNLVTKRYPGSSDAVNDASLRISASAFRNITLVSPQIASALSADYPEGFSSEKLKFRLKKKNKSYAWGAMPNFPDTDNSVEMNEIILKHSDIPPLLRDISVLLESEYNSANGGNREETYASFSKVSEALRDIGFNTSKTLVPGDGTDLSTVDHKSQSINVHRFKQAKRNIINANLDLGHPVGVGISGYQRNPLSSTNQYATHHAAVIDAYGYEKKYRIGDTDEVYYHVNVNENALNENALNANLNWDASKSEGWTLGLHESITAETWNDNYAVNGYLFNVFPEPPQTLNGEYITNPAIISGRVFDSQNKDKLLTSGREVTVNGVWVNTYDGERKASSITNNHDTADGKKGIYALAVDIANDIISSGDSEYVKIQVGDPLWGKYVVDSSYAVGDGYVKFKPQPTVNAYDDAEQFFNYSINRWGVDIVPANVAPSVSNQDIHSQLFGAKQAASANPDNPNSRSFTTKEIPKNVLNTPGIDIGGINILYVASDPQFDQQGSNPNYTGAFQNAVQHVLNGGVLIATGRSTAMSGLGGMTYSPVFYPFNPTYRPVGSTTGAPVTIVSPRIKERLGGTASLILESAFPRTDHKVISNSRNSRVLARANYVIRRLVGANWENTLVTAPVAIEYDRGDKGGKVIYSTLELAPNYAAGGLTRSYADAVLDPEVFRHLDAGDVDDALGGGSSGALYMNQMNLNMVVYNGGITIDSSHDGRDVSFAFVISERTTQSPAPQVDSSGDPELVLSLYNPLGELHGTYRAIQGDNVISVGVPASENTMTGEWIYAVEEVHGFNGERVVLAALLDGIHNVHDTEPGVGDGIMTSSNSPKAPYAASETLQPKLRQRGILNGVYHHQLGDPSARMTEQIRGVTFGGLVKPESVKAYRVGEDLVLAVSGTAAKLAIPEWFTRNAPFTVKFEHDGTLWNSRTITGMYEEREPDVIYHVVSNDACIAGGDGNDRLSGGMGNTLFLPGEGDDTVTFGGKGGTLYYRMGEGDDVITGSATHKGIRFHADVRKQDVRASRSGDDMVISVGPGSITVKNWHASPLNRIDIVEFWDEGVWDALDIERLAANLPMTPREVVMTYDERFNTGDGEGAAETSRSGGSGSGCDMLGMAAALLLIPMIAIRRRRG